jgi:hypothetical protein
MNAWVLPIDETHFQIERRYPYCPVWLAPQLLLSELVETLLSGGPS